MCAYIFLCGQCGHFGVDLGAPGWPGMSYMRILSKRELWTTWLFLYRFVWGWQRLRGLLLASVECPF